MDAEIIRQYKQVVLIRQDLGIDCGKKCVQVAHASVMGCDIGDPEVVNAWRKHGMRKIVLKIQNLQEMEQVSRKLRNMGIRCATVIDAGLTQITPGTATCVGVEPLLETDEKCITLNRLTSELKLL